MKNYLPIILLALLSNITLSNEYFDFQMKLAEQGDGVQQDYKTIKIVTN